MPARSSRRAWLKAAAAAGLFGPAGLSGLIREALAAGASPVLPGLHRIKGEVRVNGQQARDGMLVRPGDTVTTGADGETVYVIGQDAFLQRPGTTVAFGADMASFMRVVTGRILSVFGKGERFIRVSTATIGIRGTGCYIEDDPQGVGAGGTAARTYFCLCYGSVELTPSAAPHERETYATRHHDKPMYIHADMKMPKMMVPAGVINHTDDELDMLEALVGRRPPFGNTPRY